VALVLRYCLKHPARHTRVARVLRYCPAEGKISRKGCAGTAQEGGSPALPPGPRGILPARSAQPPCTMRVDENANSAGNQESPEYQVINRTSIGQAIIKQEHASRGHASRGHVANVFVGFAAGSWKVFATTYTRTPVSTGSRLYFPPIPTQSVQCKFKLCGTRLNSLN